MTLAVDQMRRHPLAAVAVAIAAVLSAVFVVQYGFGYAPCQLCHWQRYPYYAAAGLVVLGGLARRPKLVLPIIAGCFLTAAGVATYHAGVEQAWWSGPASCTGGLSGDVGSIVRNAAQAPIVQCDEPALTILGLSLAAWNVPLSLALAVATFWLWREVRG
jgi:disulfide bond formation protein DsbB